MCFYLYIHKKNKMQVLAYMYMYIKKFGNGTHTIFPYLELQRKKNVFNPTLLFKVYILCFELNELSSFSCIAYNFCFETNCMRIYVRTEFSLVEQILHLRLLSNAHSLE